MGDEGGQELTFSNGVKHSNLDVTTTDGADNLPEVESMGQACVGQNELFVLVVIIFLVFLLGVSFLAAAL